MVFKAFWLSPTDDHSNDTNSPNVYRSPHCRKSAGKIFESLKARDNFKENNTIDLREFRKGPIKKVYNALCGVTSVRDLCCINQELLAKLHICGMLKHKDIDPHKVVDLCDALEIIEYCLYEGKIDLESGFETDLYKSFVTQVNETEDSLWAKMELRNKKLLTMMFQSLPNYERSYHEKHWLWSVFIYWQLIMTRNAWLKWLVSWYISYHMIQM